MRAEHSFSVDFIVRVDKNATEKANVFARITVDGTIREISIKQKVNLDEWDSKKEQLKGNSNNVKETNRYISSVRFLITEKYRMLRDKDLTVTADTVKDAYLEKQTRTKSGHTLNELISYHYKIYADQLEEGTMKNYRTTAEYLKQFLKQELRKEDIYLIELDYQFLTNVEYFIRHRPIKKHDPCEGNGVYKHLERIKKMIRWAKKLGWIGSNPFEDYELKFKKTKRKKLHIDELISIENQSFGNSKLEFVKDLFVFSCYTGLAYADVIKLSEKDFYVSNDGKRWLTTYRKKSDELSPVPLLEIACEIIDRYKCLPASISNGTVFPKTSNQEVNRNLKIIAEICGIKKELTFHIARHTFGTTVTLKNNVPIETVSKMLGHSKLTTTLIYAEVDEEKIEEDMLEVENRLRLKKMKRKE
ncbi:site-specific integrase [Chitinophagaceae bacterium 26-R-25]|nr:site-specific integrase [Chitinophagaceae bacterium 26-R-25]